MDLAAIANGVSNNISDSGVSQTVAVDLLKKSIDIDKDNATSLIQAIPGNPTTPNLPDHLGKNINTTA